MQQINRKLVLWQFFQYMIGNTDWSIPNQHNVKMLQGASTRPIAIPYDLTGLVLLRQDIFEQYLLMEYLVYQMYNQISDYSFCNSTFKNYLYRFSSKI